MGAGTWTTSSFTSYSCRVGRSVDSVSGVVTDSLSAQEMYKSRRLDEALNPYNVMRECCDSEEHPNTMPVILALDVTGSMGEAAVEVAKKLNQIMTKLYDNVKDVEFMVMGIGDVECDNSPVQASQFESDIRIAEQLDKMYFEFGGGGNNYESYTAAWYFGSRHTKLDCWKRGKKGIIITMGDERLNPMLRYTGLDEAVGDSNQSNIETCELYKEASEKFSIYHIDVEHETRWDDGIDNSWKLLGDNYKKANLNNIADVIVDIITNESANSTTINTTTLNENGEIVW